MNCKTVRTLMSEYIDRRLDPEHATSFRAHLDECPACRQDLAAMEKTVALVRSLKLVAPPADLIQSVHARLEAGEKPRTSLRLMKVFQPVLAIAAGLALVAGIGAYFLLEHGRRPDGFTVASVEHKQAFKAAEVAQKPQEALAKKKMSDYMDSDQLRLENKAMALRSQNAVAMGRAGAGGGRGGQPAAASLPAQAEQVGAIMDEAAAARLTGRPERAVAGVAGSAGQGTASPSATVRPAVNLTIATTNRAAVEQVLLAFDVRQRKERKSLVKPETPAAAAPGLAVLAQKATPARESNQEIVITLPASQLQDLLAQLKLQGTISVTDHDRETAQAPSKMKAEGSMSGASLASSDLLTVQAIITVP